MTTTFIIIGVVFYITIACVDVSCRCAHNFKFHEGGFLNMGFTSHDSRDATAKDMWLAVIWPLTGSWWFLKTSVWVLHDFLGTILIMFGIKYKNSNLYHKIDNILS